MIKITHIKTFGFEAAIRGMRNPLNSWDKSDSHWRLADDEVDYDGKLVYQIGKNDLKLMRSLIRAGTDHRKFLRMINVTMDITAPFYWWKEFDTYKVGTVANSCSTMHKLPEKKFTIDDFSHEHLFPRNPSFDSMDVLDVVIEQLNGCREVYLKTKDKKFWWQMIQLLPSSYNQKRTVQLNYEVLLNMYHSRKNHKLDEWREFCEIIKKLPYMEELMKKEKYYLGISLGFNSSACIYSNERGLVAAVSQERLNGEKNTKELPFDAILACCKIAGTNKIHKVCISHYERLSTEYFDRYDKRFNLVGDNYYDYIFNFLKSNQITCEDNANLHFVNHHVAHAHSTFGFYGIPVGNFYTITSDGFGHGESGTIAFNNEKISSVSLRNSIALVYQFVTGALGFKEHQHEGKITGLAAFGEPIYMDEFMRLYDVCLFENHLNFKSENYQLTPEEIAKCETSMIDYFDDFLKLKKAVYGLVNRLIESGAKREDIAATVQEFAELHTIKWIRHNCKSGYDVYIAGGLFANVKINQRIKDMKDVDGNAFFNNVYVCPAMGDEGTAVGAAVRIAILDDDIEYEVNNASSHVISGTETKDNEVPKFFEELCSDKYMLIHLNDSVDYISKRLSENKIVCLMREQMEFGPRALCHRSILYNADSRETNDWLNKKLSRTEFMPFAPVTREEVADDLFVNLEGGRDSAKFMTMTFDCTEEFAENYKAACHIDNTARPQIISKTDDEYMWEILERYQALTGKKAMINTSFNLHNNPIIESVETAIKSWIKSDTDVLVIGNYAIEAIR